MLRVDRSTKQRLDAVAGLLEKLGDRPGILVGTQILAKGHDLPHLTLVVVVGVDEGLFSADFRAGEKLAQQLIQVAGRAGRAQRPGEVRLQTHHPDHPLLNTLIQGGYHAFAENELEQRQAAGFPPFAHLALLRAEAKHVEAAEAFLRIAKSLCSAGTHNTGMEIPVSYTHLDVYKRQPLRPLRAWLLHVARPGVRTAGNLRPGVAPVRFRRRRDSRPGSAY